MNRLLLFATMLSLSASGYALDMSKDVSSDRSIKKDSSMSVKTTQDNRSSNRRFNSAIDAKAYSSDISFDPMPVFKMRANRCVNYIATAADFGLSSVLNEEDGSIDYNRKNYIDAAAGSSMKITAVSGAKEKELKNYMACIINESARMAQASINLQQKMGGRTFTSNALTAEAAREFDSIGDITDRSIFLQYQQAFMSLNQSCRFIPTQGRDSVQCGSLTFSLTDNSIRNAGTPIAGAGNIFGVTSTFRVSISDTRNAGLERASEHSKGSSSETGTNESASFNMTSSTKKSVNIAPFLPK